MFAELSSQSRAQESGFEAIPKTLFSGKSLDNNNRISQKKVGIIKGRTEMSKMGYEHLMGRTKTITFWFYEKNK